MYLVMDVLEGEALLCCSSNQGIPGISLAGTTFDFLPIGAPADKLRVVFPKEGLEGIALCFVDKGDLVLDIGLLLSWWNDKGKLIVKDVKNMSLSELKLFNPFTLSKNNIWVTDKELKFVYSNKTNSGKTDPEWTYLTVSTRTLLEYITKKIPLEELSRQASSEQILKEELAEPRKEKVSYLEVLANRAITLSEELDEEKRKREEIETLCQVFKQTLLKSQSLFVLLKKVPARFLPRIFDGFMQAMRMAQQD